LPPAALPGTYAYDRKTSDFVLRRGPIFTQLLLADEINRAPPKTQSALLEAMQERQATLEGETFPLDRPFFVIATQNPIEHEGTYPLPEAQVDRFLLRIDVGYPTRAEEVEVLERRRKRRSDDATIEPVTTPDQVRALQAAIEDVHVDPAVEGYMVDIVGATRGHSQVEVGASPRGALALLKVSRPRAAPEAPHRWPAVAVGRPDGRGPRGGRGAGRPERGSVPRPGRDRGRPPAGVRGDPGNKPCGRVPGERRHPPTRVSDSLAGEGRL